MRKEGGVFNEYIGGTVGRLKKYEQTSSPYTASYKQSPHVDFLQTLFSYSFSATYALLKEKLKLSTSLSPTPCHHYHPFISFEVVT